MNYLSDYTIAFSALKEGGHQFDFAVDERFFEKFEQSEIKKGNVKVQVKLEKRSTYLRLTFILAGEVELVCDRCLDNYLQPIKGSYPMLVKFSETETDDGDDVIYIHPGAHEVKVAGLIYEFIVLSIPIRHIHPEGKNAKVTCNPEMISKLSQYKATEIDEGTLIDPRWNDLKNIIDK